MNELRKYGIYTQMNIIQVVKKNEILKLVQSWMDLQIIMLNEMSQAQKDKYCMISFQSGT
jgi:hypothetical protein